MPVSVRTRLATRRAWRNRACSSGPALSSWTGQFVGFFHLPGDLSLADDQAVEAGGDAEQMPHGLGLTMDVQVRMHDRRAADRESRPRSSTMGSASGWPRRCWIVEDAAGIQLDAIAGTEDDRLAVEAGITVRVARGQLLVLEGRRSRTSTGVVL